MESSDKKSPQQILIDKYISEMTEQQKIVLEIAQQHLETSFDIVRSIGYKEWLAKQEQSTSS